MHILGARLNPTIRQCPTIRQSDNRTRPHCQYCLGARFGTCFACLPRIDAKFRGRLLGLAGHRTALSSIILPRNCNIIMSMFMLMYYVCMCTCRDHTQHTPCRDQTLTRKNGGLKLDSIILCNNRFQGHHGLPHLPHPLKCVEHV